MEVVIVLGPHLSLVQCLLTTAGCLIAQLLPAWAGQQPKPMPSASKNNNHYFVNPVAGV